MTDDLTQPTEIGRCRYPPDGLVFGVPCTCTVWCRPPCRGDAGIDCYCKACGDLEDLRRFDRFRRMLVNAMADLGISLDQCGEAFDVPPSVVGRWIDGKAAPSLVMRALVRRTLQEMASPAYLAETDN